MASANYFFKKIQHFLIIYMFFWASSASGSRKNLKRRIKKITISSLGSIFHFCGIQKEQIYPVRIGRISPCFSALQEVNYKGWWKSFIAKFMSERSTRLNNLFFGVGWRILCLALEKANTGQNTALLSRTGDYPYDKEQMSYNIHNTNFCLKSGFLGRAFCEVAKIRTFWLT